MASHGFVIKPSTIAITTRFELVDHGYCNDLERRQFETKMAALDIEMISSGEPEKQAPRFRKLQRVSKKYWPSGRATRPASASTRASATGRRWACGRVDIRCLVSIQPVKIYALCA